MPKIVLTSSDHKVKEFDLTEDSMPVGRVDNNKIVIQDASMSGHHATLNMLPSGDYGVKDLNSTNGTFVNSTKVTGQVDLKNEDKIRFGKVEATYISEVAPATEKETVPETQKTNLQGTSQTPIDFGSPSNRNFKQTKNPFTVINIVLGLVALLSVIIAMAQLFGIFS